MGKSRKNIVYGYRAVEEAFSSGKSIDKLMVANTLQGDTIQHFFKLCKASETPFQKVPREKLNRITQANHQGVLAFLSPIEFQPLDEVIARVYEKGEQPFLVALDEVSDVRNFGAIARSALSAGVHALVVPYKGAAAINEDAIKTSAGALLHIPVCKVENVFKGIKSLQLNGIKCVGLTEKTENSFFNLSLTGPLCLMMGSEESGLSPTSLKTLDELGKLPMKGEVSSLNVSVAAGIAIYEALKQRGL